MGKISDAAELARLHRGTIRNVLSRDYAPDVIKLWSSLTNAKKFRESHKTHIRFIAEHEGKILGWGDIGKDGQFGGLYVHKDWIGKGIGSKLIKKIEETGRTMGVKKFLFEASVMAKPFYERHGYTTVKKSSHKIGGKLPITVYVMEKKLR